MGDERVRFILDNVYALCRLQNRDALAELQSQASSSKAVSEFLEDPRYIAISLFYSHFTGLNLLYFGI